MKEATLFVRAYDLYSYLLDRHRGWSDYLPLAESILQASRILTESVTLALKGFDTLIQARRADKALTILKLHLRMAEQKGLLERSQYRHTLETAEDIGRQLGGWLKSMNGL